MDKDKQGDALTRWIQNVYGTKNCGIKIISLMRL